MSFVTDFKRQIDQQLTDFIEKKIKNKNVLLLVGARQVGKTTSLLTVIQKYPHLSLNLEKSPLIADEIDACKDFAAFEQYLKVIHAFDPVKQILLIDEAQESLHLGRFVRFMKEEWSDATVILTGSTLSELHRESSRIPVGRQTYLHMGPMSFTEFLQASKQDRLLAVLQKFQWGDEFSDPIHQALLEQYNTYLLVGGLPEVVKSYLVGEDYQRVRKNIFKSYEKDFLRYYSLDDINLFRRCLEAVAQNVSSPSKDSQVVRTDTSAYRQISSLFAKLEQWKLVIKSEQLGFEPEKNKFHAKRYLYDLGVLRDLRFKGLTDVHINDLSSNVLRTPLGGLIENAVALALVQQFEEIFGLKLSSRSAIDFAVKVNGVVIPIECKAALKFKGNYLKGLLQYHEKLKQTPHSLLLYGGPPIQEPQKGVFVMPYYLCDELGRLLK